MKSSRVDSHNNHTLLMLSEEQSFFRSCIHFNSSVVRSGTAQRVLAVALCVGPVTHRRQHNLS